MYRSYFKIAWRSLIRDKGYSLLNIGGLSVGIAVAAFIGLWINDELSFNKEHDQYQNVAEVLQNMTVDGKIDTYYNQSYQLGAELRDNYGNYFKHVVMSYPASSILSNNEKVFTVTGSFMEADAPELLSVRILEGSGSGLQDPSSILLSATTAQNLFNGDHAIGRMVKLDNSLELKVVGVFKDVSPTSSFNNELSFIAPLEIERKRGNRSLGWVNNWLQVYVVVADHVTMDQASSAIKDAKMKNINDYDKRFKPELFLHPMSKWHLYSGFKNGVNEGGLIEFVWLFGAVGVFVLLLACINFMNLSTARAQKRGKEVGVRKVIGSRRIQLIRQFFSESLLVVTLAFIGALLLIQISMPLFNEIANKNIAVNWTSAALWSVFVGLILFTSLLAGSYPAFYLSGFSPVQVLKGSLKRGSYASMPRRLLVITQFTVSIMLVIGTIAVYQQIQHARNRPLGYALNGLITLPMKTQETKTNYTAFRNELLATRLVAEVSTSETTVTNLWWSDWGFEWKGKDPNLQDNIYRGAVDFEYGKTIGWTIKEGRDFSRTFATDSSAMILNEAAVRYMGFDKPVGETIRAYGRSYTVIGVVKDMVTQSLYSPVLQTVFLLDPFKRANFINVRLSPEATVSDALTTIGSIFTKHNPHTPFDYKFADDEFAEKFAFEARVGRLVGVFSVLAVLISCLGLFGLASYVAEQRTKEIGIRRVLGAPVVRLWQMLSGDFVVLVLIACAIAVPLGYYVMNAWLETYDYRTEISWQILLLTCVGAIAITLITVSVQALKAAMTNPVKSLRSE
jgi:putative ABC transport system permease protein